MRDGRVVPNFIAQALRGEDVTVYGDGNQTRSFCYVTDLVEGILRLLWSDHPTPVNVGNPREMTVLQFAKLIIELVGSKSRIVHKPLPVDDPKVRQPDITLARKVLNDWQPVVPVEEGLKRTIEYFASKIREGA
jgi:nucleoside-diphosphate-sugar epimerase